MQVHHWQNHQTGLIVLLNLPHLFLLLRLAHMRMTGGQPSAIFSLVLLLRLKICEPSTQTRTWCVKIFSFLYILPDPLSSIIGRYTLIHPSLQDKSLQVTISKLPYGSLTCTGGDFPCTGDIQLMSQSEGRCTYLVSSLQMTLEKKCLDTEILLPASADRTWDL